MNVLRYICQNPLRLKIVKKCENYKGSFLNWILKNEMNDYLYLDDIKKILGQQICKKNY